MADEVSKVGLDASQLIAEAKRITTALLSASAASEIFAKTFTTKVNAAGKTLEQSLTGAVDKLIDFKVVMKQAEDGTKTFTTSLSQTDAKVKENARVLKEAIASYNAYRKVKADTAQQKELRAEQRVAPPVFSAVKAAFTKAFGEIPADASIGAIRKINREVNLLVGQVARGEISFKQLFFTIDAMKNKKLIVHDPLAPKAVQELTGSVGNLAQSLLDVNRKSKAAFDATAREAKRAAREVAVEAEKAAKRHTGIVATERAKIVKEGVSTLAPAAFEKVKGEATKFFGDIPADASIRSVNTISQRVNILAAQLAKGDITAKQLAETFDAVSKKKILPVDPTAPKAVQDLTKNVSALAQALTDVNTKSKTAAATADKSAVRENLRNALARHKEFLKARDAEEERITKAATPATFAAVHGDITAGFGKLSVGANTADVQRIQTNMNAIVKAIASGKVAYKDFTDQMAVVKSKTFVAPSANEDINRLRGHLSNIGNSFDVAGVRANTLAKSIISLDGVIRLFTVQALHAAFARFINLMQEASKEALELGRNIALIQTISQDAPASINEWTDSLRRLSDELGRPINEVAKATYQAISNQMVHGREEAERFIKTAAELSRTLGVDTTEGVNLLTTATKGLGLSTNDVNRVAAIFFNTVDYGKITAQELNQALGRAIPTAKDLGVSLEEVGAGAAVLTLQGLTGEQAITRLGNVLLAFEKPSEELSKFFASVGARSGKDFVRDVGGFENALKEMAKAVLEGNLEIAKAFPELRKMAGALGLTTDQVKPFSEILQHIRNDVENFNNAVKITGETPAQKLAKEMTQLQNIFTVDFAKRFQEVFATVNDAIGGTTNALKGLFNLVTSITYVAGSWAASFYALKAISFLPTLESMREVFVAIKAIGFAGVLSGINTQLTALKGIEVGLHPFSAFVIGATAANEVMKYLEERYKTFLAETEKTKKIELDLDLSKFNAALASQVAAVDKTLDSIVALYAKAGDRIAIVFNAQIEKQKIILKETGDAAEASFKGMLDLLDTGVRNVEEAAKRARDNANSTSKEIADKRIEQGKEAFELELDIIKARNKEGPALSEEERALRTKYAAGLGAQAKEAFKQAATGTDATAFERGKSLLKESVDVIKAMNKGYVDNNYAIQKSVDMTQKLSSATREASGAVNELSKRFGLTGEVAGTQIQNLIDAVFGGGGDGIEADTGAFGVKTEGLAQASGNYLTNQKGIADIIKTQNDLLNQQVAVQTELAKKALEREVEAKSARKRIQNAIDEFNKFSFLTPEGKPKEPIPGTGVTPEAFRKEQVKELDRLYANVLKRITEDAKHIWDEPLAGQKAAIGMADVYKSKIDELTASLKAFAEAKKEQGKLYQDVEDTDKTAKGLVNKGEEYKKQTAAINEDSKKTKDNLNDTLLKIKNILTAVEGSGVLGAKGVGLSKLAEINPEDKFAMEQLLKLKDALPGIISASGKPTPRSLLFGGAVQGGPAAEAVVPYGAKGETQTVGKLLDALAFDVEVADDALKSLGRNDINLRNIAVASQAVNRELAKLPLSIIGSVEAFQQWAEAVKTNLPEITRVQKAYIAAGDAAVTELGKQVQRLQNITPQSKGVTGQALGGLISGYYDTGGNVFRPKGTDVIPAMLSPGEHIMPAKQSAMFLNELELMRKGINPFSVRAPSYQEGGFIPQIQSAIQTTNNKGSLNQGNQNFGNINVHVTDTTKNPNLGTQIGQQIRRELRRGTMKF